MGRGPGGAADRNPEIAPAGKGETDPSSGAVDGSDGDDVEPEKGSEVGVEGRIDAMAGGGDVVGSAGVVAAPFDMALERLAVGPWAEGLAFGIAGDDHGANVRVVLGGLKEVPQLGVHAPRPGVPTVGPAEGDGRNAGIAAGADIPAGGLEVH